MDAYAHSVTRIYRETSDRKVRRTDPLTYRNTRQAVKRRLELRQLRR